MMRNAWKEAASMMAAIWIGLILGVSFYATPIKFAAERVSYEQLLLVGQITFKGFVWVEFCTFALLSIASWGKFTRQIVVGLSTLLIMLIIQKFIVLPNFNVILDQTVAGKPTEKNNLHFIFGTIEVLKVILLFFLYLFLRQEKPSKQV